MHKILLLLSVTTCLIQACKFDGQAYAEKDPVIYLDSLLPRPAVIPFEIKINDKVAIVDTTGEFQIECEIQDKADTVYLIGSKVGRSNLTQWVTAAEYKTYYYNSAYSVIQNIITNAYKVRIGEGRFSETIWVADKFLYKAPWINISALKKGDSVIIRQFGDFEPYKAIVTDDVKPQNDFVYVKYNEYSGTGTADYTDVFYSVRAAQNKDIVPGNILYFDKMYWVMVILLKDENHAIVRNAGFAGKDMIVPLSKLEVYE